VKVRISKQSLVFLVAALLIGVYAVVPRYTEEQRKLSDTLEKLQTDIIFDSNRSGTFGIHMFNSKNLQVEPLYDSPMHEINPDASPDGKHVVFAKGKSAERGRYYDIWIVDRFGNNARELAKKRCLSNVSK
jgi:hypothetical protein